MVDVSKLDPGEYCSYIDCKTCRFAKTCSASDINEVAPCPECGEVVKESDMVHHLTVVHQWSLRKAVRYGPLGGGEGKGLFNV